MIFAIGNKVYDISQKWNGPISAVMPRVGVDSAILFVYIGTNQKHRL